MRPKGDLNGSKPLLAGGEDDGRGVEDLLNKATLIDRFKTHKSGVKLAYSSFRGLLFDLWFEWRLGHNRAMRRCCSSCSSCLRRSYSTQKSFVRFNLDTDLFKVPIIVQITKHFTNTWLIS